MDSHFPIEYDNQTSNHPVESLTFTPENVASNLDALSSTIYTRRDNDKLDMISRAMMQYEVDIKSLKARATIAIGLVSD